MVDVVLVLLVIMMVSATYIVSQSLKVELPKAASSNEAVPSLAAVTIAKDGKLYFNSSRSRAGARREVQGGSRPTNDVSLDRQRRPGRAARQGRARHRSRQARGHHQVRHQRRAGEVGRCRCAGPIAGLRSRASRSMSGSPAGSASHPARTTRARRPRDHGRRDAKRRRRSRATEAGRAAQAAAAAARRPIARAAAKRRRSPRRRLRRNTPARRRVGRTRRWRPLPDFGLSLGGGSPAAGIAVSDRGAAAAAARGRAERRRRRRRRAKGRAPKPKRRRRTRASKTRSSRSRMARCSRSTPTRRARPASRARPVEIHDRRQRQRRSTRASSRASVTASTSGARRREAMKFSPATQCGKASRVDLSSSPCGSRSEIDRAQASADCLRSLALGDPRRPTARVAQPAGPTSRRTAPGRSSRSRPSSCSSSRRLIPSRRRPPASAASVILRSRSATTGIGRACRGRAVGRPRLRRGGARGGEEVRLRAGRDRQQAGARSRLPTRYDFVFKEEPIGPIVNFEGVVRDRATKKPLAGRQGRRVEGAGRSRHRRRRPLRVRRGPAGQAHGHDLRARAHGDQHRGDLEAGKKLDVKYTVDAEGREAPAKRPTISRSSSSRRASRKRSSRPRSRSRKGAASRARRATRSRSSRTCPAWRAPPSARAQLVVWGAAPQDTRVYVDGVRVPLLYHGGGLRSTVNSDMVRAVDLAPGGYGAEYGRGLGGLVTVELASAEAGRLPRLRRRRRHRRVGDDRDAARRHDPRRHRRAPELPRSRPLSSLTARDVGDFVPDPVLLRRAGQDRARLGPTSRIELFGLVSRRSRSSATVTNPDPAQTKSEETLVVFWRGHGQATIANSPMARRCSSRPRSAATPEHASRASAARPTELDEQRRCTAFARGWRGSVSTRTSRCSAGLDIEATRSNITPHRRSSRAAARRRHPRLRSAAGPTR